MTRLYGRSSTFATLAMTLALGSSRETSAQAVAFQPVVGSFPNGVTLPVTPVVSADRRYVRMTLNPQFNAIEGFDPFSVPGAVAGGGSGLGAGGLGGLGGGAGGLGGGAAGGGFRSVSGGTFDVGMDGVASAGPGYGRPSMASAASATGMGYDPSASGVLAGGFRAAPPRLSQGMAGGPDAPAPKARSSRRVKAKRPTTSARSR